MLKYYSYYNVGGYKDMFLGDSTQSTEYSYYIPLLPIWKKRAESGDSSLTEKIESLEKLPKINILTKEISYGLPSAAKTLISHGGYRIYLSLCDTGESIFSIRDIKSNDIDESGRATPFLFMAVGTTDADRRVLEKLTAYAISHTKEFSSNIANCFQYDNKVNGLSFNLKALNNLIEKISNEHSNSFTTPSGKATVELKEGEASLLVLPEGIDKARAIKEQNLQGKKVKFVKISSSGKAETERDITSILGDKKPIIIIIGIIIAAIYILWQLFSNN